MLPRPLATPVIMRHVKPVVHRGLHIHIAAADHVTTLVNDASVNFVAFFAETNGAGRKPGDFHTGQWRNKNLKKGLQSQMRTIIIKYASTKDSS